ncbi:V-type H+-transporting ATPase subunit E [Nematocida sp. AWRm77]|nr:V-type H+-transporting ATPase subunit E [Nematocida sp. AWRm77]
MPARAATSSEHQARKHSMDAWDMGRMLKFIEQESEQKAHEIRIKANEEYSIEIAEMAVKSARNINLQKKEEISRIQLEKVVAEGKLRLNSSITLSCAKEEALNELMKEVCASVASKSLSVSVAQDTIDQFKRILPNEKMFVYIMEKDRNTAESLLQGSNYVIERMDSALLGGMVIRNATRSVLINNSYLERVKKIETLMMPSLRAVLFN